MLQRISVKHYRSLRDVTIDLGRLTVVTGSNGSGKSNLYQALGLIQAAAHGRFRRALLDHGGMPSALWAGDRPRGPIRMRLGIELDDMSYDMSAGLVGEEPGSGTKFVLDPEIKEESLHFGQTTGRASLLIERGVAAATLLDVDGERRLIQTLDRGESVMAQVRDPARFPELTSLRHRLQGWRFYHHFDTRNDAPIRRPQPGVRTNVLAASGDDLAAAIRTLEERGDAAPLHEAVGRAFPGYRLIVDCPSDGVFAVQLAAPGLRRPLTAAELSDGQLRFLCLAMALLTTRPPELLVLNEPETSLHSDAVAALAPLIVQAADHSQVWTATHDLALSEALAPTATRIELTMSKGETVATSD